MSGTSVTSPLRGSACRLEEPSSSQDSLPSSSSCFCVLSESAAFPGPQFSCLYVKTISRTFARIKWLDIPGNYLVKIKFPNFEEWFSVYLHLLDLKLYWYSVFLCCWWSYFQIRTHQSELFHSLINLLFFGPIVNWVGIYFLDNYTQVAQVLLFKSQAGANLHMP